jgi:hypothetical protein
MQYSPWPGYIFCTVVIAFCDSYRLQRTLVAKDVPRLGPRKPPDFAAFSAARLWRRCGRRKFATNVDTAPTTRRRARALNGTTRRRDALPYVGPAAP